MEHLLRDLPIGSPLPQHQALRSARLSLPHTRPAPRVGMVRASDAKQGPTLHYSSRDPLYESLERYSFLVAVEMGSNC